MRQSDHEKDQGKSKNAERLRQEADKRAKEISIDVHGLEEFPKLILDMPLKKGAVVHGAASESKRIEKPAIGTDQQNMVTPEIQLPKAKTSQLKWTIDDFNFEYDRPAGKLNISKGLDGIAVRLAKRSCTSADVEIVETNGRFKAKDWNLEINLSPLDTDRFIEVEFVDLGIVVRLLSND